MPRYRQEVVNVRVADLLRRAGFKEVAAEVIAKGNLPDVMINVSGLRVVLEGWFEKSVSVNVLKEKCRQRIEDNICDVAIGLFYSDLLKEAESDEELVNKIEQSDFETFVFYPSTEGVTEQALGKVKFEQLAENINYLYSQIVKTDLLKEAVVKVEEAIQTCAEIVLTSGLFFSSKKVIEELKEVLGIEDKTVKAKFFKENLAKMALFIIFDGLLFHQSISSYYKHINGLEKASETNVLDFIKEEWKKIMKINYLPIFVLAFEVVNCLPVSPETDAIFKTLKSAVLKVISSGVLLKHDLMGRVYHKLLLGTTGKFYASYYTSIPAAVLLSNLVVKTENPDLGWDFSDLEKLKELKIVDPACGSGTLLSAIYMALKNEYVLEHYRSSYSKGLDFSSFHKFMIEEVLHGWDVLDYASHLTLVTLAFHNPNSFFERCKIYTLPSGIDKNGKIYLGSLSLLENVFVVKPLLEEANMQSKEKSIKEEKIVHLETPLNSIDIVIMNPPFSRSCRPNVKFGYTDEETRTLMNKKLGKLGKELGYEQIGQAGLGAYFIVLADKLLKEGGRMALVIPRAFLSGVSWREIRDLFFKYYEIEYIVSNYDPGSKELGIEPWNWSENTDLGEVLIVARKTNSSMEERFTTFINLWNKPKNEIESLKIAFDSAKTRKQGESLSLEKGKYKKLILDNKEIGVVYNVSQKYLKRNFLIPCLFANPHLNQLTFELVYKPLFQLVPLGALVNYRPEMLGVDIKQIKSVFTETFFRTPYRILWGHNSSMNTLELNLSQIKYGQPIKKNTQVYNRASNFLIADRPHLKTESLIAMYSEEKVLATAFWEIQIPEWQAKILTLWLNSTFGFLIYLSNAVNSMGEIFKLKKEHLENLPVIDLNIFDENTKETLLSLYEKFKQEPFKPFSKEFEFASKGKGIRKQIDDAFVKLLKLKINLQPYYEMLAKEPILTLERC